MNALHLEIAEAEAEAARLRRELGIARTVEHDILDRLNAAERRLAALRQREWDHRQAQKAARERQGEAAACDDGVLAGCGVEMVCH